MWNGLKVKRLELRSSLNIYIVDTHNIFIFILNGWKQKDK